MKKRLLSLLCVLALCLGLLPSAAFAAGTDTGKSIQLADSETAANIGGGQADNIYFGNYFQSSSTTKEPVKWRVLSNSDGKLFLLSDQNLDVKPYNSSSTGITWEKSTIRSWLNGYAASENNSGTDYSSNNFIDAAFSSDEQVAIADTYVYNKNKPSYSTSGGENTTDQIFLLSIEEANNSSYFPNGNDSRKSTNTAYVASYSGMLGAGKADYWWLRSPGEDDDYAAFVDDGGVVYNNGYIVVHTNTAVRPAFNLNLNSVLFTSAAAGGKSASGMDSGLTAVGGYDGNEWKLTLLDSSRNFSVTEETASGKPGDTITLNYTGASTGDNENISVILADDSGAQYYGRIAKPTTADGQVKITIPASLADGTYTLNVFSEQYNGGENDDTKLTDYASAFEAVTLTVDTTAPTLSNGSATRDSETTATVKFTSDEAGEYYYTVVESGATEPTDIVSGDSANMASGENTITLTNLTAGTKDIYIVAKDAMGNVSQTLQIVIPEFIPTYTISASPAALNFSNKTVGYTEAPDAKTVTITNTGNQEVTVTLPTGTNYTITAGTGFADGTATLAPNGTATFAVQPKTGLAVGSYSETLTISSNHNTSAEVSLAFTVDPKSLDGAQVQVSGSYIYDGNAKKPSGENVTVTLDGEPLTENTDYTLSYEDNTDAGEATVKVSGKGNYSGTVTGTFQIAKATPDYTVPTGLTATYGNTLNDVTLTSGWTWDDAVTTSVGNVGDNTFAATFTPSDTDNYNTVTENLTVAVSAKDITNAVITLGDVLTYTGQEQTQQIASITVGGLTVTYTVTGNTGTDAGAYTLTVTGTGNFTGEATQEWSIAKATYTGTTGVPGTVLANWPDEVTLPDIPDGASYGAASTTDDLTGLSIEGGVLSYTGGESITEGQEYKITVPVNGGNNYENYDITVTLTGTDKRVLDITGVTAQGGTYTGQAQTGYTGTPSAEGYDGGFTVTYSTTDGKAPTDAGTYTVTIAIPEDNAQYVGSMVLQFTIAPKALTVSAPSPSVYVGDSAPELALTYTGLVAGESVTPSEDPVFTITKADGTVIALEDAVKTAGTYTITWSNADQGFTGDENYEIQTETAGTLTVSTRSSGGGSSSNITTETTKNPDGSTTITVTNKVTGTVTETTTWPDGSKEVIETKKDGTVTTTTTDAAGNQTAVVEKPDGSSQTTVNNKDGSGSVTLVDADGNIISQTTLSEAAIAAAQAAGEAVALPMPAVPVTTDQENAPTVTVDLPGGGSAKVEIPVEDVTPGTVAVLVKANGDEEVVKTSVTTENGVAVTLNDGDTVKIVDNSRDFADVPDNYWGAEAVAFAASRELFNGTGENTFSPDLPMTRAMSVTVLARLEGVDTTAGSTWYEAGQQWAMQNGISDGSNMEQGLTREQLATMLYRYAQSKGYDTTQGGMAIREYADFEQISGYAVEAMTWAVNTGIIKGTSSTTISPQSPGTRAQMATILMRFIEMI